MGPIRFNYSFVLSKANTDVTQAFSFTRRQRISDRQRQGLRGRGRKPRPFPLAAALERRISLCLTTEISSKRERRNGRNEILSSRGRADSRGNRRMDGRKARRRGRSRRSPSSMSRRSIGRGPAIWSFSTIPKYVDQLAGTRATACLVGERYADRVPAGRRRFGRARALSRLRHRHGAALPRRRAARLAVRQPRRVARRQCPSAGAAGGRCHCRSRRGDRTSRGNRRGRGHRPQCGDRPRACGSAARAPSARARPSATP